MKTYPQIARNEIYRKEQSRHIDSPFRLAVFEALWSGTDQLQPLILRDGAAHYQKILGQLRIQIRQIEGDIDVLEKAGQIFSGRAETWKTRAHKLAGEYATYRDHSGRRCHVDNSRRVATLLNKATKDFALATRSTNGANEKRGILKMYREADERLTAALVLHLERAALKAAEIPAPPAPPVFNVRVESPTVNLEATIDVPPAEVTVNLPPRRTIGTIERDHHGNITRTEQIETDLDQE